MQRACASILPVLSILAFIAVVLAACRGGSSGGAAEPARAGVSAPERVVVLMEELARSMQRAGTDCGKVAAVLSTWTRDQSASYPALSREAAQTELSDGQRQVYEERLASALRVILGAVSACEGDPGTQAAFARFDVLMDPS